MLDDRGQRWPRSSFGVFDLFLGRAGRPKSERFGDSFWRRPWLALSEHGPCLVGGTMALDDISFTTKIAIHSGGDTIAPYRCVALLDTGSPQTLIRRDVLGRML